MRKSGFLDVTFGLHFYISPSILAAVCYQSSPMQFVVVALLALVVQVAAFRGGFLSSRLHRSIYANKLDNIEIAGDLHPLSNNLLIKVKEIAVATQGGLFIPDNAKERPTEGTCVAAGPGRVHPDTGVQLDIAVNVNENVIYGKYDGTELKYNDVAHQMIKDDDVLLKYTGKEPLLANVECVKDQILVKLPPKEESNASGIIINTPGSKDKRPDTGIVTKVGPGRQAGNGQYMKPQVAPGDGVKFREFAGNQVKIEGEEYVVVRGYDILAKW